MHGVGRDGFTGGNPATQVPATIVTADWLNAIQEEIARAIELDPAVAPLAKANNGQLAALINTYGKLTAANAWTQRQRFNAGFFSRVQSLQHTAFDIDFADDAGLPVRRTYAKALPTSMGRSHENIPSGNTATAPMWVYQNQRWRSTGVGSGYIDFPLFFPNQFSLEHFSMLLTNGSAQNANVYAWVFRRNWFAGGEAVMWEAPMQVIAPGQTGAVGTGIPFLVPIPGLAINLETALNEYVIRVQCVRDTVYLDNVVVNIGAPGYRTH